MEAAPAKRGPFSVTPTYELIELLLPHLTQERTWNIGSWRGAAKLAQLSRSWRQLIASFRSTLTHLQIISPPGQNDIPLPALYRIAAECKSLQHFELTGQYPLEEEAAVWYADSPPPSPILFLALRCQQLRVLIIGDAYLVGDREVYAIAANCRELQQLELLDTRPLSCGALRALGTCPLTRLRLGLNSETEDDGVAALVLQVRATLQRVTIKGATDVWVSRSVGCCLALRDLRWDCQSCESVRVLASARLRGLATVRLGPKATDVWVRILVDGCPGLTNIALNAKALTDDALNSVGSLVHLRHVSLTNVKDPNDQFTHNGFRHLTAYTELRSLALCAFALRPQTVEEETLWDETLYSVASSCPMLDTLWLGLCGFSGVPIKQLAPCCPHLRYVCLDFISARKNALRALRAHCSDLRRLELPDFHLEDSIKEFAMELFPADILKFGPSALFFDRDGDRHLKEHMRDCAEDEGCDWVIVSR